jgi:hypothetical protein
MPGGDHEIVIGRVLEVETGEGDPLIYYRGRYAGLQPGEQPREPATASLPTRAGCFTAIATAEETMLALLSGDPSEHPRPLVHVHTGCTMGEVFASRLCTFHRELDEALARIASADAGVFLYVKPSATSLACTREHPVDARAAASLLGQIGVGALRLDGPAQLASELRALGFDVDADEVLRSAA